ncbi:MAG: T9SS type A sorting domain-containing protein [Bacteroidota bacterium]
MKLFEPFDDRLEIYSSGKTVRLKSKVPIPCCWIKVSDAAGKIVFKKIETDLTETQMSLDVKAGFYQVTLVTGNSFVTKMIYLE